jgi:tRNA dimethylallyltransferase
VPDSIEIPSQCSFIAIVGPTAVGKSDLAMRIAALRKVEIVNADSRQVYRHMDVGTSKPTLEEQALVTHHLLDVVDPDEDFSLADYLQRARSAIRDVAARGHLPLLVGGSGQYVWALLQGWNVAEVPPDMEFRREMEQLATLQGHRVLHEHLAGIDQEAARRIQSTNVRRVIRALELFRATGVRPSELLARRRETLGDAAVIGLTLDRPLLFARVDARIATMMARGFPEEVKTLLAMGYDASLPSMSSIGYREMAGVVTGSNDLDTATELIARETRRLVRRQYSWFRLSDRRIMWLNAQDPNIAARQADELIQGRLA